MTRQTFGLIITNRSFFPAHLVAAAKNEVVKKLDKMGYGVVTVSEEETACGAVVTYEESKKCAELFKKNRDIISGIIVVLPNFGEELGVADAIDLSGLNVPVLVQACDDDFNNLSLCNRRDAFCGKISVCNNLYQRGIKFTDTKTHTCKISSEDFTQDVEKFAGVCRVVNGIRGLRVAAIGARPNAFNTVRYSEKLLQKMGVSVCTVDMSEIIAEAKDMADDAAVMAKVAEIESYGKIPESISQEKKIKQAKLCITLENWIDKNNCNASAIQCWDSIQNNYGCATCLAMSMMGEKGKASACEMDVTGAVTMYAMYQAAKAPPAYMDWNNNVDENRNMCINLHCSNFPKSFFKADIEISNLDVLATTIGAEKCFGACKAQVSAGAMTFGKLTTDDANGKLKMYLGEGEFCSEKVETKGGVALCKIDKLQGLLKFICKNGFEHHVAMCRGNISEIMQEAFGNYLGVDVHLHNSNNEQLD